MSDFLVSLARRAAGLAPIIRARAPLPPVPADASSDATPSAAPIERAVDAPPTSITSSAVMPVAASAAPTAPMTIQQVPATAQSPTIVQRVPIAVASAPAPPTAAPAVVADASPIPISRETVRIEPAATDRAIVSVAPSVTAVDRPVPARVNTRPAEITPATIVRARPSEEPPRIERHREVVKEETRIVERAVEGGERVVEIPVARIEPVGDERPVIPAAVSRAEPVATPERVVHVRIGAIEIHGAEPMPATPQAPSVAPAPGVQFSGGFGEFARLRSYAPWQW